jgi:hypothetical protein
MIKTETHEMKPSQGTPVVFTKQGRQIVGHSTCPTCGEAVAKGGHGPSGWYHSN